MELVLAFSALALMVTKSVDLVRNTLDADGSAPKWTWNVLALAAGVAYALGWQVDLTPDVLALVPALESTRLAGVAGQVITGLALGAGAGFFHDLLSLLATKAREARSPT